MKLTCICCGKRWNAQHVLRDKPEEFHRLGAIIRLCPACHGCEPSGMTENERLRLRAVAAVAKPFGDYFDRLAASNADLNGLTFRFEGDLSKLAGYLEKVAITLIDSKGFRLCLEGSKTSPRED